MKIVINKKNVSAIPLTKQGTKYYLDSSLPGFGVRVGKTKKSFYAEKRVNKKPVRVTLGQFPLMHPDEARKAALLVLGQLSQGVNLNKRKVKGSHRLVRLRQVLDDYLRKRSLKPRTRDDYHQSLHRYLPDWLDLYVTDITKDMVGQRHLEITARSPAQANQCMRILRAMLNFARAEYDLGSTILKVNPVRRISEAKTWNRIPRRQTVIPKARLGEWVRAVLDEPNLVHGAYLITLLLTGMRRGEGATLRWDDVDLDQGFLTLKNTKNHHPHRIPFSDYLWDLFRQRYEARENEYVFPGKNGHIAPSPPKTLGRVAEKCGVRFCLHDLRRTFSSIAEASGITGYTLKRLLNHSFTTDITGGYIVTAYDADSLREPLQRITDYVLAEAGIRG